MTRRSIVPLVCAVAALVLGGCATTRNVAGEPSPKEDAVAVAAADAAAPAQDIAGLSPDEVAAVAPPPVAPAGPAGPAAAPQFIPSGKPQIVARVERVQFPAWIERAGIRAGIKAGWAVYTGDRIITGPEGRVELGVAGDGRLKISGDALVEMTEAYEFTGSMVEPSLLKVRRGTIVFAAPTVRSGGAGTLLQLGDAIDANVLGGQLVGRVDSREAILALVDAVVQVSGPKLNPGVMREKDTFLRVPNVGRAQPVTTARSDLMVRWLSSAERVSGRPVLSGDGNWDVSLNSGYSLRQLEDMACRIQRRGYPTEIYAVSEPGKLTWYRVVVRRFDTKGDAVGFLGTARALGSKEPWVLVPKS